jgi:hypothetical protein
MRTTTILIALGLGICLPAFAQEKFFETPGISLTGTNVIKDPIGILAEMPTLTIRPGDVVQESIESQRDTTQEDLSRIGLQLPLLNYPTNAFRVRWRYTGEAAKQTLAFREMHEGQSVRTVIGAFSRTQPERPAWAVRLFDPVETKSRWLATPVDGIYGLTEEQAKQMVADLKSK